jgi:hypothetical protein
MENFSAITALLGQLLAFPRVDHYFVKSAVFSGREKIAAPACEALAPLILIDRSKTGRSRRRVTVARF